jgi:polyphosphate kinase 2
MSTPRLDHEELMRRISRDLADGYDEELEMEIEDRHPLPPGSGTPGAGTAGSVAGESATGGPSAGGGAAAVGGAPAGGEQEYRRQYFQQLFRLQAELVKLQDWVVATGAKVLILFEGRDAAGKGGAIKRVTQRLNPRVCRVVALPAPNDRERTQWYFQRYVSHLPAAGEIVLFDRSWYNRAGVERVMGFCTPEEYEEFFRSVPEFERMLVRSGITLLKYWFSITDEEQYARFLGRIHDPLKQWKLSPMDLESRRRWEDYTKAKEVMLERSHIPEARWWVVHAVDKKRARLNFIDHLLKQFPYEDTPKATIELPKREHHEHYSRQAVPADMLVPEVY